MAKSKIVTLDLGKITIEKQGLLKWAEVASTMESVVNDFVATIETTTEEAFGSSVVGFLTRNIPVAINILQIATPLTQEQLENEVDPYELTELILAIVEVNNLAKVNDSAKKIIALFTNKKQ